MNKKPASHVWKAQKLSKDCETIDCPEYDTYEDFVMEPSGHYCLIKVNFESLRIEVAICNKDHTIIQIFSGRKCQDIYDAIFKYEQKNNVVWFHEKTHIAYLGKELKKAELALAMGNASYFQE